MPRPRLAGYGLAILTLTGPLAAAADPAARRVPEVVRTYDRTFASPGGEDLKLDLVVPKAGGPHPVVLCLHGGAWKFGSRKDLSKPARRFEFEAGEGNLSFLDVLAREGYAAASASYRFAPKHKFPAQVADAKAALRYLRANAKPLNLDPDRVAVLGFSAGGHIAALVGTTPGRPEFDPGVYPGQSDRVSCVVNFFGPTDLSLYQDTPGLDRAYMVPLLGAGKGEAGVAAYARASPVEYVSKDSPPVLTFHGTADLIVPILHAERLHEKLLAAGATSVFVPVKGKGHGWGGETAVETTAATVRFLAEHLTPPGKKR